MSRRGVVLGLGILLALLVLAIDRFVRDPTIVPASTSDAGRSRSRPETSRATASLLERATESSSPPSGVPRAPSDGRELEGSWIHGRVVVPEGLPPDDHLQVAARYVSLEDEHAGVSDVDADGRFVVAFPPEAESGWLELRSRYLYLDHEVDVDFDDPPEEVVLEPRLGGCVRGRLVPSRTAKELAGTRIEMWPGPRAGPTESRMRTSIADAELEFEIPAVEPSVDWTLKAAPPQFLPERKSIAVGPGQTTEVSIGLHECARVSGRVFDPEGKPVDRAFISWAGSRDQDFARRASPGTESSDDGSFSIRSVRSGPSTLLVGRGEYLPERRELGSLQDGQHIDGLEIRLRSAQISGVVRWADGRPVRKCQLLLAPVQVCFLDENGSLHDFGRDILSSSCPQFSFYVDSEGPFRLSARTDPTVESGGSEETGIAQLDDVRPGQPPITVVLRLANTVRGKVVDDLGHPVLEFSVSAMPVGTTADPLHQWIHSGFRTEDGAYALGGLSDGEWRFNANALGVAGPESDPLEVPLSAPLVLVVPRPAELSGVVLEPSGTPAVFADVEPSSGSGWKTDANGRFHLPHVEPGQVSLTASSKSWAPSEPLIVEVKPGGSVGDLVLKLRRGGRVAGTVFDAEGAVESGVFVSIESADGEFATSLESDAAGRFESEWLAPGNYSVSRSLHGAAERDDVFERVPVSVVESQVSSVVVGRPR